MHLGLVGLGRMGGNMRERIRRAGHDVVGFDVSPTAARDVASLAELVAALPAPRIVWVMVPAGAPTRDTVAALSELLEAGDLVVDGGNSRFTDDLDNAKLLSPKGIGYLDCGVSGGIWGLENGYGLMAGGAKKDIARAMPIFDALRPEGPRELGFVHAGSVGAGHYAKMVHNGIEYALMHAYGEGYELLERKDIVTDVAGCFKAWSRGTVVRSWLLDLLVKALDENPRLDDVSDYTNDSGEGRWTVEEAIAHAVPMPVISASLFARFASRQEVSPALQAVAALRGQFGGHAVMTTADGEKLRAGAAAATRHAGQAPTTKSAAQKSATKKSATDKSTTTTSAPTKPAGVKAVAKAAPTASRSAASTATRKK